MYLRNRNPFLVRLNLLSNKVKRVKCIAEPQKGLMLTTQAILGFSIVQFIACLGGERKKKSMFLLYVKKKGEMYVYVTIEKVITS